MMTSNVRRCMRCVNDESVPGVSIDDNGICNACHLHDALEARYPLGEAGDREWAGLVEKIKSAGKGKKYDCIVGVSGGCDSSYLLLKTVESGLRPLAVHFDNTWNSPIATQNIYKIIKPLNVDLFTYVVDSREYDDILKSMLVSGSQDFDAPTDLGFAAVLYLAAKKHGIKYIIEGHSFRTEGVSPLNMIYMDGRYIKSVHKQYGKLPMKTYPLMTLTRFLYWTLLSGISRIRPLYYFDYHKESVKAMLAERFQWEWYGGHHLENRYSAFSIRYLLPKRLQMDQRYMGYAALVRTGQMDRDLALKELLEPVDCPPDLVELVRKRLNLTEQELADIITLPRRTWRDFPNYKKTFEQLRPLFYFLVKIGRVPESFYRKFCFPIQ